MSKVEKVLHDLEALHRPKPTGREEYRTTDFGVVQGIEPTYECPSDCEPGWFFEGDECKNWKLLKELHE